MEAYGQGPKSDRHTDPDPSSDGLEPGGVAHTPSQTVGPFFHDALIRGTSSSLVGEGSPSRRIEIVGRVLDGDGTPVDDAMVEIWQPDANGVFPHPADPNARSVDPHFSGFGRSDTSDGGRYRFETVMPGVVSGDPVSGQAPFISVRVFARGLLRAVVTRLYFPDEDNDPDPVLGRVDPDRRHTLVARLEAGSDVPRYRFDIRLQGQDETVFFDVGGRP